MYFFNPSANGGFTPAEFFLDTPAADASTVKVKMGGMSTSYLQENCPGGAHLDGMSQPSSTFHESPLHCGVVSIAMDSANSILKHFQSL
jgi:hypothetical protein